MTLIIPVQGRWEAVHFGPYVGVDNAGVEGGSRQGRRVLARSTHLSTSWEWSVLGYLAPMVPGAGRYGWKKSLAGAPASLSMIAGTAIPSISSRMMSAWPA